MRLLPQRYESDLGRANLFVKGLLKVFKELFIAVYFNEIEGFYNGYYNWKPWPELNTTAGLVVPVLIVINEKRCRGLHHIAVAIIHRPRLLKLEHYPRRNHDIGNLIFTYRSE